MKKEASRRKGKTREYSTIILFVVFFIGLSVLLYPTVSDYYNSFHESRAVASYETAVAQMDNAEFAKYREAAQRYNAALREKEPVYHNGAPEDSTYGGILDVTGNGMMGYIEIPLLRVRLPIYHGTAETVLAIATGHLEGSSLPVGGAGTHSVITGHRGLPSAKLFTSLDKLELGDVFTLSVLDEVLTYQVDDIAIVEPLQTEPLNIIEGEDYCTLVTCTPYGVNSHRLLIRGTRITTAIPVRVTADASLLDPVFVAPAVAAPILLALLVLLLWQPPKRRESEADVAAALLGAETLASGKADGVEEAVVGDAGGVDDLFAGTDKKHADGVTEEDDELFVADSVDGDGEALDVNEHDELFGADGFEKAGESDCVLAGDEIKDMGENDATVGKETKAADGADDDLETLDLSEFPQDAYTED